MADGNYTEFSIIRHEIFEDDKFKEVIGDPEAGWTWVMLLVEADKAWPAPAAVPFGTKKRALDKLAAVGIVDVLPHNRYFIHGMSAEREKRSQRFRDAVNKRWERDRARRMNEAPAT